MFLTGDHNMGGNANPPTIAYLAAPSTGTPFISLGTNFTANLGPGFLNTSTRCRATSGWPTAACRGGLARGCKTGSGIRVIRGRTAGVFSRLLAPLAAQAVTASSSLNANNWLNLENQKGIRKGAFFVAGCRRSRHRRRRQFNNGLQARCAGESQRSPPVSPPPACAGACRRSRVRRPGCKGQTQSPISIPGFQSPCRPGPAC